VWVREYVLKYVCKVCTSEFGISILSRPDSHMHMRTNMQTHTHQKVFAAWWDCHPDVPTYMHIYTYTYIHVYIYTHTRAHAHTHTQTRTHTHMHTHAHTHNYMYTHVHTCIHIHPTAVTTYIAMWKKNVRIFTLVHTRTHAYTYIRSHSGSVCVRCNVARACTRAATCILQAEEDTREATHDYASANEEERGARTKWILHRGAEEEFFLLFCMLCINTHTNTYTYVYHTHTHTHTHKHAHTRAHARAHAHYHAH